MEHFSLANSFNQNWLCVFNFPQRPFWLQHFSPKKDKIQAIFMVQSLKISIWSCTLIYFFRLDSLCSPEILRTVFEIHQQLCQLSGSLYIFLWIQNCQCFFCNVYSVFKDYLLDNPGGSLLVMDDNGSSCPISMMSSIIKVGSANARLSVFPLVRTSYRQTVNSLGGTGMTLANFSAYSF